MADIGSTLREARMRARIDINEVESRTKIRARYLRAMENEEWDLLPGPVYVKSFLRTYGDFLGLDSRMLVDEYKRRYERPADHEQRTIASIRSERERAARGPLLPSWAVIGGVLVAVAVALFAVGGGFSSNSGSPTTAAAPPPNHRRHRAHHAATATPAAATTVKLQLVPTGTVYVCLVDGAGAKLIDERTFTSGEVIPTETAGKLLLTLGNNAVTMKVNGHTVPVAASTQAIRLLIDPSGEHPIPSSMPPTCP
jgi:cytoskeleton protein RodZ